MITAVLVSALASGILASNLPTYQGVQYSKRGATAEAKSKAVGEAQYPYYDENGQNALGDYYDYNGREDYPNYPEYAINQEPLFASGPDYPEYAINQDPLFASGPDYPDYYDQISPIAGMEASFQTSFNNHTSSTQEHTPRSSHVLHHDSLSTMVEINSTLDSIKELLERTIENDPLPTLLEINSTLDIVKDLLSSEDDPLRNISEINQDLDVIKNLLKTIRQSQTQTQPTARPRQSGSLPSTRVASSPSRRRPSARPSTSGKRRGSPFGRVLKRIIGK